ncbi:DUF362 domain-containing protein [Rugosimonospora africana]|nr:DUF362 domain-containing protein [Rugosimonospora africana]
MDTGSDGIARRDSVSDPLGPFEAVRQLHYDAPFPSLLPVRQRFEAPAVKDVAAATMAALEPVRSRVSAGMRVAITVGSRGIADKPAVVRAAGQWLRSTGAEPFAVAAMGSHGGATEAGQLQVLTDLGMTEQSLGMPILATMETVNLGPVPGGPTAHLDRHAHDADAILLVNRVKAHTDFNADIESGLAKILAVGLGKQRGAEGIHAYGPANLGRWIPRVARRIIDHAPVLGGLAIVENAYDRAARIAFVEPDGVGAEAETALLGEARRMMATLPFDDIDVAVVQAIGKDKSGTGLDTNVVGRMMIRGTAEFERPRITNIVALEVSKASHGNALGVGLADFIPLRLLEGMDLRTMYVNAMTSGLGGPQRCQIPMAMPTDRDAIAAAILTCGRPAPDVRVVQMRNTLELEHLLVSESLRAEVERDPRLELLGDPSPMAFDTRGRLETWL